MPAGRPPTGRSTKVARIPHDIDAQKVCDMYYEWLPILERYAEAAKGNESLPRYDRLCKLLEELGLME